MIPNISNLRIAVDVDLTIIDSNDNLNIPLIERLKLLKKNGCNLVCWSAGGIAYAKDVIERHGLNELFDEVMEKFDFCIDDQKDLGIIHVYPKSLIPQHLPLKALSLVLIPLFLILGVVLGIIEDRW